MTRYKTIDGITTECTAEEVAELNALKTAWDNKVFDRAIANLRNKRNRLLAETDYMANSDVTMSSAMTTYRQAKRYYIWIRHSSKSKCKTISNKTKG